MSSLLAGCLGILASCGFATGAGLQFFVDPAAGDDTNNGTSIEAPFLNIDRARQAVAQVNGSMTGDIEVHLRGGIHRLTSPLAFGPQDSGNNGFRVIYRNYDNEPAVISGGIGLTGGWTLHDASRNIWKKSGVGTLFRDLTVNGRPAIRARYPNRTNDDTFGPFLTMIGVSSASKEAIIPQDHIANWSGLQNVEMVMHPHWYTYRGRIDSYTLSSGQARVTFRTPENDTLYHKGDSFWTGNVPYYFENSIDFLDAEGEWFLDTAGSTLYYKPRPGENLSAATVEAPALDQLVVLTGNSASEKVHDISFQGLSFTHSGWNAPSVQGSAMTQGAREIMPVKGTAALSATYADRLEVRGCAFRSVGLNAISLDQGVTSSRIVDSEFRWIAGNGIVVHDRANVNPAAGDQCVDVWIANNFITRVGQLHSNGIGIVSYYVKRLRVMDNEIGWCPYMATQTGGQPGATPDNGMMDNILRNNYAHHVMQFHDDGGAFYTLAQQPGTHVVDNHANTLVATALTGSYPVAGLYADNSSQYITFERNATVNCARATYEQTGIGAKNNVWTGNVTSADADIVAKAGIKPQWSAPVVMEAEAMTLAGFSTDASASYANAAGVRCASGTATASTVFAGESGPHHIHIAYLAEPGGSATYKLRLNGTQVDAWTAMKTPTGTDPQIRHRLVRGVTLANGDVVQVEGTAVSGFAARLDYVEIYRSQSQAAPAVPALFTAKDVTQTTVSLGWEPSSGALSYLVQRASSPAGPFVTVATGLTDDAFVDSGRQPGQTYQYRVIATNASGSGPAAELSVTTMNPVSQAWNSDGPTDTWNGTDLNWASGEAWTSGNIAVFGGATGEEISVESASASGLDFSVNGYRLSGGSLTLVGDAPTLNSAADVSISAAIAGTKGLTKTGPGTVALAAANGYTGPTTIDTGTMEITGTGNLGGGNYAGAISNNGTLRYGSNAAQDLSGVISGTGQLIKQGPGMLTLSGVNAYTGATTVNSGTLRMLRNTSNPNSIATSGFTVNSGGTLDFSPNGTTWSVPAKPISLNGGTLSFSPTAAQGRYATGFGAVTVDATSFIAIQPLGGTNAPPNSSNLFLDGGLMGGADLTLTSGTNGLGTVLRTVNTNYSGKITVNGNASATAGTGSGLAIGWNSTPNLTKADIVVNGTMEIGGGATGLGWASGAPTSGTIQIDALGGTGMVVGNLSSGTNTRTLSVGNNHGSDDFSGQIVNGSNDVMSFVKNGGGTQILSGSGNSYTGTTTVSGGTLLIHGSMIGTGAVTVSNAATLGGGGSIAGATTILSGGTLAPGNSTGNLTFTSTVDLQSGSTYTAEIAGAASNDKITASGTLTINGTTRVVLLGGYTPAANAIFDLADATIAGTPTFDFTAAALPAGRAWDTASFAANGSIKVISNDPFDAWATANNVIGGKGGDDDGDGVKNLMEFATAANPQSGGSGARAYPLIYQIGGRNVLTYTVAVRAAAIFAANGSKQQAERDNVRYVVEASDQLGTWDSVVVTELAHADASAVQTALSAQLGTLDPAWQWHSFRADGDITGDPSDFIRINVTDIP